ncbi:c-type cytochrome biogenesis protein CcmI [Ferrimonas marina]|uniref:Cytochrome c-type biogenesis protein CcmI n=1 Tax=Ferrimonas marina TaxID=299255 RepID=A0A1M5X905_9GAMM|nr:c-type cytochrome biogenesis protein CcmI [Ferrimonas marina]SHH95693.1 cytochrome c-type biogenesis protein CcmI [Ferrimonas marina]
MNAIWLLALLASVLMLSLVWLHHWRYQRRPPCSDESLRRETNLSLFRLRQQELERAYALGDMTAEEKAVRLRELELALLQDVQDPPRPLRQRVGKGLPFLMTCIILVGTPVLYGKYGEPVAWQDATIQDPQAIAMQREINQLIEVLRREPENVMAWYSLGQASMAIGRYDHAISSFDQLMGIVGSHPELLGHRATAMYYLGDQVMTPEIRKVTDEALSLDSSDPTTRLFLATHEYLAGNLGDAIDHWQVLLDSPRGGIDLEAIRNAQSRAKAKLAQQS